MDQLEDPSVDVVLGSGVLGEGAEQDPLRVLVGRVRLGLPHQQREDRVLADVMS